MRLSISLFICLFGFVSLAQNNNCADNSCVELKSIKPKEKKNDWLQVSYLTSGMGSDLYFSADGINKTRYTNHNQNLRWSGLSVGYLKAPSDSIGWTSNLTLGEALLPERSRIIRIDGGAAMLLRDRVLVKGGINFTRFFSGDVYRDLGIDLGYQAGFRFIVMPELSLDFGFAEMKSRGDATVVDPEWDMPVKSNVQVKMQGFEVGVTGTF